MKTTSPVTGPTHNTLLNNNNNNDDDNNNNNNNNSTFTYELLFCKSTEWRHGATVYRLAVCVCVQSFESSARSFVQNIECCIQFWCNNGVFYGTHRVVVRCALLAWLPTYNDIKIFISIHHREGCRFMVYDPDEDAGKCSGKDFPSPRRVL